MLDRRCTERVGWVIPALEGKRGLKDPGRRITAQAAQPVASPHQPASLPLVMDPMVTAAQPHQEGAYD